MTPIQPDMSADDLGARLAAALGPGHELLGELGGGGMSRVFLVHDRELDRRLVAKVLPPGVAQALEADRFRREIRVAAQLQHPNVVPLLSAGEVEGLPWYLMPYVAGDTLRARLAEAGGPLPVPEVVGILRDVARALAVAHAAGVVHRDIKADNVLLASGAAMVSDFGIAKALDAARHEGGSMLTTAGTSLGTPAYMAPEQAAADPSADHRADLYSLGVLGYEMLTGRTPFAGRSLQQMIAAHITEAPTPLAEAAPVCPPALGALLMDCLAKDPSGRPATADAFLERLESGAMPAGHPGRRRVRWPWMVAAAAVVLAAVVVGMRLGRAAPGAGGLTTVAVLPFATDPRDSIAPYLAEGIADELAVNLSRLEGVRVASRTSSFALASGPVTDLRAVGRELDVGTVLGGRLQRRDAALRAVAELVNTDDGFVRWSDTFSGEPGSAVEVTLAQAVASRLAAALGIGGAPPPTAPATDAEAYDLYLQARHAWRERGEASLQRAAALFRQSIARDPGFARAHAGLADALALLPLYGSTPGDSVLPEARTAAERALELDSTLSEPWTTLGLIRRAEAEWGDAEAALRRAVALNPSDAVAQQWLGELLYVVGRPAEGVTHLAQAASLDPVSPVVASTYGYVLSAAGEMNDGVAAARRGVALAPDLWVPHAFLGTAWLFGGVADSAVLPLERAMALAPELALFRGILGYAYAQSGRTADARATVGRLEAAAAAGTPGAAPGLAVTWMGLGDHARALDWLERAVRTRDQTLLNMSLSAPWFAPLRGQPRFVALGAELGLPPAVTAPATN